MENATTDAEDGKLWPPLVEKHFIDVLVKEELRGNMLQCQFKTGLWTSIVREFNLHANKNYNKEQLRQKYQILKVQYRAFSQLLGRTGIGWDPISKMAIASDMAWASANVGLQHYELLGQLFNANTATSFLQISSAQPAPNSFEERELDAAFLSSGVHVNDDVDSVDDVEELPTPGKGQSRRRPEKWAAKPVHSSGRKKKEAPLKP
ncbi:uncharacterized protein LOC142616415 [Castanea sativa]|uniref:uncharacterized protein LOC142616415 n=1 Tax=Castanea sativa TaxID=21020 RepID=UPI003F64A3C7